MKEKIIKTNYKVAVLTNQMEKRISKAMSIYLYSRYQVVIRKVSSGTRYIYIMPDKCDTTMTSICIQDIFNIVKPYQDEYRMGDICCGVKLVNHQEQTFPAVFVMISNSYSC